METGPQVTTPARHFVWETPEQAAQNEERRAASVMGGYEEEAAQRAARAERAARAPLTVMKIALGVFLGNMFAGIAALIAYQLLR